MEVLAAIGHASGIAGSMGWEILWALILGFALSAVVQAMAFKIGSTNLVVEPGIILALLLGWQFTLAEFVDGPLVSQPPCSSGGSCAPGSCPCWR